MFAQGVLQSMACDNDRVSRTTMKPDHELHL